MDSWPTFNRKSTPARRSDARKRHNFPIRIERVLPLRDVEVFSDGSATRLPLARIEESLEMRERLADWCCFVHLAHETRYRSDTRFSPLCMKEPAEGKKHRKIARRSSGRNCTERDCEEGSARRLSCGRTWTINNSCPKVFLCKIPIRWSAIPVRTQRVMQLLTGTWQSHVSL